MANTNSIVMISGLAVDASKGFWLVCGKEEERFDTYEAAEKAYKAKGHGYIRYYVAK